MRSPILLLSLFFACQSHLKAPDSSRPSSAKEPTSEGCAVLHQLWREQRFGESPPSAEEEASFADDVSRFPCALTLSLDRDQRADKVVIANQGGQIGLRVFWGDGREVLLGAGQPLPLGPDAEAISDFDWLASWRVVPNVAGAFSVEVLRAPHQFPAPDALGDGLLLDGGDAFEILYWSAAGWRLLPLGF